MKYFEIFFLGIVVFLTNLPNPYAFEFQNENVDLIIHPGIGFRIDDLKWSIADQDGHPNILSELEFNDLIIFQYGFDFDLTVKEIYLRSTLYYGGIIDGKCTDSDYYIDNREGLFSRSESEINNDDVQDITVGLGYQFYLNNKKSKIAPLIGISDHQQNLRITNGVQTVATPQLTPAIGSFPDLNSTYQAKWNTWWLGMDAFFKVTKNVSLSSSLEFHTANYKAKADWNLRDDFAHPVSYTHKAKGKGIVIKVGINKTLDKHWNVGLMTIWQDWRTSSGIDKLYFSTGETISTKLNKVDWESKSINLFFSYKF